MGSETCQLCNDFTITSTQRRITFFRVLSLRYTLKQLKKAKRRIVQLSLSWMDNLNRAIWWNPSTYVFSKRLMSPTSLSFRLLNSKLAIIAFLTVDCLQKVIRRCVHGQVHSFWGRACTLRPFGCRKSHIDHFADQKSRIYPWNSVRSWSDFLITNAQRWYRPAGSYSMNLIHKMLRYGAI